MPELAPVVKLLIPACGALVGALAGLAVRTVVIPRLTAVANHTRSAVDDVLVRAIRGPLVAWAGMVGVLAVTPFAGFDPSSSDAVRRGIVALLILSVSWVAAQAAGAAVQTSPGGALPSARILSSAARVTVLSVGALAALQTLGISVTPVLTALGVGGLAVGLALQDTLANLFGGFQVLASRQVRPGDFVQLSTGEQGFVEDITWRNTTIRQLPNDIVIVPNARLAQAITINYNLPDPEQATLVQVGVSYDDDLQHVERVTTDVARSVQREVEGAVPSFDPFVRFHTFGESSVDLTVIMRARRFTDHYLLKHEFVKRLHARYRAEGITIPYPQRTVHVHASTPAASE
jgi:small-conductance mechanosensitive channel